MRIQSNDIVILDTTDTKKIDLHITSNHPTVQIYNSNDSQVPLTPDWSQSPLVLTPIIYIDAEPMTDDLDATFTWTMIKGNEANGTEKSKTKVLTISTNEDLDNSSTIRYKCEVQYNNKSFFNEITFVRVSAGKDGASGNSAPAVKAQYSADGDTNWVTEYNPQTHKYIHFSYDNGATWSKPAIKIAGEDGKSVQIKGVAYAKTTPITGQTIALYSDEGMNTQIVNATNGDSYLVDGYLCVYNGTNFVCVGQIQGPPGVKGDSYYLFIRYAENIDGSGISTIPNGKSYIGFYRSSVNQVPTDVSSATWNWAKFVGEDAKSVTLTSNAQVFKVDKSNTITPEKIIVTAQAINTTIPSSGWTYSVDGGKTFSATAPTGVTRSGDTVTLAGASIISDSIVIKASDGPYSDFLTIYKAFDGTDGKQGDEGKPAPIVFLTNENISFAANESGRINTPSNTDIMVYCNVVAYSGTTKVTPTIGTILSTEIPTGMTIAPNRGIAYTNNTLSTGNIVALYSDNTFKKQIDTTNLNDGDSYVVGTYLCRYNKTNNNFVCKDIIVNSNEIQFVITIANNATLGSAQNVNGTINIPITSPVATTLQLTWSKINSGANGSSASLVDITPSALYFKSATGKNGTFTPEFIYLYPRFQNATYSNWQYSIDGGVNWVAASGANGLTISTYNSMSNVLRISRSSTLYTDSITSISFRCNSTTTNVYDTVSIAKLFDVDVDEINTRITDSLAEVKTTTDSISSRVSSTESSITTINNNISSLTTRVSSAEQKITPTAIVSTVRQSTDYTNDLGKKVNSSEIISKINQTAESVTISANKIGLLGATNIPDLTADKIKGGTLTLGGSSATTQNGQLLVKNASNVDMLKVNKDGLVVKSGHLAVAREFTNSTHNWDTDTWTTTNNTSQLDLGDDFIHMGFYSPSGYTNMMRLLDTGLYFQGTAQGTGSWGSFIGHDSDGYFVVQDSVRSDISFRGSGNTEMANLNSNNFNVNVPVMFSGGISYVPIVANTNLNNIKKSGFYKCAASATAKTLLNCPTVSAFGLVVEEHAGVKQTLTVYLTDNQPIIYIRNFYNNVWGTWSRLSYAGESTTLWTGAILSDTTITVKENIRNFKFLTCIMGDASISWGITMGAFMDSDISELHFGAIYTDANSIAGANLYGVRFKINSTTSLTMQACGTKSGGGAYMRKIVGWR